ncbi:hypothetical protein HME9302_00563 [Alteripontixanthobacter maritimus]|uniref:DUF2339 domain-containing protein n=1 Tax=Alteripontixanthobacter maritimus TaxID=2161824 RepID=A0A369Q869_9SPHN|nr:DUF2339 domain-containing protein [Alteripontixanthobacter maritimus]RDC59376.1 hypothetical protein HME9302_00563 [Alteripontixanthobacter maritimus]
MFEWLAIFALCAVTAKLWTRSETALSEARELAERVSALEWRAKRSTKAKSEPKQVRVPSLTVRTTADPQQDTATEEPAEDSERALIPTAMLASDTGRAEYVAEGANADLLTPTTEAEADGGSASSDRWIDRPNFKLPTFDFEEVFGRYLPIWAGGITLAVAGFFLVRYSIDAGLLSPGVRVALGFTFGIALIAAAEGAYRFEQRLADDRVRQALAGAGIATLFASFYMAGTLYGLIGSTVAFVGMATVTAAAIGLSFRFGLPCAVLGLVGGFAAPMMVGGEEANVPLLSLYLALVTAGLVLTGRSQQRAWLGIAAIGGGLGWGLLLLIGGLIDTGDRVAFGIYMVVLGAALPTFAAMRGESERTTPVMLRIGAAAIAALQLATMVASAGFEPLSWGLYLLLSAGVTALGWLDARFREASGIAGLIALGLLALWPDPSIGLFAPVVLAAAAIFAGVPLALMWQDRARWTDIVQVALFSPALAAIIYDQFGEYILVGEPLVALPMLALAIPPALAAWLLWPATDKDLTKRALLPACGAFLTAYLAWLAGLPVWMAPIGAFALTALAAWIAGKHVSVLLSGLLRVGGLTAIGSWALTVGVISISFDPAQITRDTRDILGALQILGVAGAAAIVAWRGQSIRWTKFFEIIAALGLFGAGAWVLPDKALGWYTAAFAIMIAWKLPVRSAAAVTFGAIAGVLALFTFAEWAEPAFASLGGVPFLMVEERFTEVGLYLAPPFAAAAGLLAFLAPDSDVRRRIVIAALSIVGLAAAHWLFKHVFWIDEDMRFDRLGLIERTVWQAGLSGAAFTAWHLRGTHRWLPAVGIVLSVTALAHFAVYTLGIHNPLWDRQAVGALPVLNWLVPAYAAGVAAILLVARTLGERRVPYWARDAALMLVISAFALSQLRQGFAGSWLTSVPITETEDLLRSLLGIVLAVGFLLWGSHTGQRSWRVGSLVLMLLAVLKVFLFDTAGLEGLARIASFMALGFSLIGIGWFYSRQLRSNGEVDGGDAEVMESGGLEQVTTTS